MNTKHRGLDWTWHKRNGRAGTKQDCVKQAEGGAATSQILGYPSSLPSFFFSFLPPSPSSPSFLFTCLLYLYRHDVQLHAPPSSTVPDGYLPSNLQRRIPSTTPICQPTAPGHSTLPANKHHRPTGFLCGWSVGVEFFARLLAQSCCWQRHILTTFENVYVRFVPAHTEH